MECPHVIVRFMPTVYAPYRAEFVVSEQYQPKETTCAFVVVCQEPYLDGGLTAEARKALLDTARRASRKSGLRMCVVFGNGKCVYVHPDGKVKQSVKPPSGGIQRLRFPIQLRDA